MLTILAVVVTAMISWGVVDFLLGLTRESAPGSLAVYAFAFATGAIIGWAIVDGIAFAIGGDVATEA